MYYDNRAKFSMVTTRIACAKYISLMGVTSHDVGSFQSCSGSVSNIYDVTDTTDTITLCCACALRVNEEELELSRRRRAGYLAAIGRDLTE